MVVFVIICFFFFYLYLWNIIFLEYLFVFYVICLILNCLDDLYIVINNGVYDEIFNIVLFKDDFYFFCEI